MNKSMSNMYGTVRELPQHVDQEHVSPQIAIAGYQQIRESVLVPEACLFQQPDYCVSDADFINPLINEVLEKYYDGAIPTQAEKLQEVKNSVFAKYRNALYTTEGLQRVEKLLEKRYQSPLIKEEGGTVSIDFGVIPGRLAVWPRYAVGIVESGHLTDGEWNGQEIGQMFQKYSSIFPYAHSLRLMIKIPSRIVNDQWVYHYSGADDRIIVVTGNSPSRGLATPAAIGRTFDPYIRREKSLHSNSLIHIRLSEFNL